MKPVVVEYLNASGIMGREVSLTCKASGDPLPEVTFLKEGTLIPYTPGVQNSDDRIIVDTSREGEYAQARLVIRDLMRSDDGLYACIAKNNGAFHFFFFSSYISSFIGSLHTRHPPSGVV
jgi:neurocan core protein